MTYFQSRRSAVTSRRGSVATSQPLAAQIGLKVLMEGGHAVDAAVATSAALGVVEPHMTGIGGDLFALVWDAGERKVSALNASGRSAKSANAQALVDAGFKVMPEVGEGVGASVTVPGTVDGWHTLLGRFGRKPLRELLAPAISLAADGYVVSEVVAAIWKDAESKLTRLPSGGELLANGGAPSYGDIVALPTLAATLTCIANEGRDALYLGSVASRIADYVQQNGGCLTVEDLAAHHSTWDEPISTDYRGTTVWECPPNGQGLTALMAMNIAEGYDLSAMGAQSANWYHTLIESIRLSFADAFQYIADPRCVDVPTAQLLDKGYADSRRRLIDEQRAIADVSFGTPHGVSDTVYLTVVDGDGNACSLINSLYAEFGGGLVVPGLGMALQNRGANFSLQPGHLNLLEGGKRPYQTIIPALATRDDELWLSFGVMGGHQQPQGHLQVISNMVDFGMDSQAALDALRFRVDVAGDGAVELEAGVAPELVTELERRGHVIRVIDGYDRSLFGGGQIISRNPTSGVLIAGSEPRIDGAAVGW